MKPLLLSIFGALLYLGTSAFLTIRALSSMPELGGVPVEAKTELAPRLWSFQTEAVNQMIAELTAGREKVAADEKNLAALQAQLASETAELAKTRDELKQMREEIDERVIEIQDNEIKNLKTLAQTYATMAAPAAVSIFREMDETMVVKILACMKADRVGPILGEMGRVSPADGIEPMAKRAARISDKLRLLKPLKKENAI